MNSHAKRQHSAQKVPASQAGAHAIFNRPGKGSRRSAAILPFLPMAEARELLGEHLVITDSNECPADPEEFAEAYLMGTLSHDQVVAFEEHYVGCAECATILQRIAAYVDAMRAAAEKLRSESES